MNVLPITMGNFEAEVLNSDKPVFIDFWAPWCGPCKAMSPIVEEIAGERNDIKICSVNVDDVNVLARKFRVMGIPTFILIKDGEVAGSVTGAVPKEELIAMIEG